MTHSFRADDEGRCTKILLVTFAEEIVMEQDEDYRGGPGRRRDDGGPKHHPVTNDLSTYAKCGLTEAEHESGEPKEPRDD